MAFTGMSFNLFDDSGLTTAFSGTLLILNETDLSDNPQDFVKYLGSNTSTNQLQATSDPGVDNITLTPTDTMPEWTLSTAYVIGDRVQAVGGDGFIYKCTTAGTSNTTQPSWPVGALGSTVVDNTVVWTKLSIKHEITEIKLALSSGALGSAVAGDPLDVDTTVLGGVGNAIPIYIRVTNAVTNAANNTGYPEIELYINEVIETAIP